MENVLDDLHNLARYILHNDVANRVLALQYCPLLPVVFHEAEIFTVGNRNQRAIAIMVVDDTRLHFQVQIRILRKNLCDRSCDECHELI